MRLYKTQYEWSIDRELLIFIMRFVVDGCFKNLLIFLLKYLFDLMYFLFWTGIHKHITYTKYFPVLSKIVLKIIFKFNNLTILLFSTSLYIYLDILHFYVIN